MFDIYLGKKLFFDYFSNSLEGYTRKIKWFTVIDVSNEYIEGAITYFKILDSYFEMIKGVEIINETSSDYIKKISKKINQEAIIILGGRTEDILFEGQWATTSTFNGTNIDTNELVSIYNNIEKTGNKPRIKAILLELGFSKSYINQTGNEILINDLQKFNNEYKKSLINLMNKNPNLNISLHLLSIKSKYKLFAFGIPRENMIDFLYGSIENEEILDYVDESLMK